MISIIIGKMTCEDRMAVAIGFARVFGKPHFQFSERNTVLTIGFKDELKSLRKTEIFSALPHDDADPESWGAMWIPNSSRWGRRKDLKMWSDEYVAQQRGISLRKEVEHA